MRFSFLRIFLCLLFFVFCPHVKSDQLKISTDEIKEPRDFPSFHLKIKKSERKLYLYNDQGKLIKSYAIALGFNPIGKKTKQGDGATPEGEFYIFTKNPESAYYLSLGVSYPNTEDAERGLRAQLISEEEYQQIAEANRNRTMPPQSTALGGLIYIHGHGSSKDWTWGCVALDDGEMLELFEAVQVGTKVVIEP